MEAGALAVSCVGQWCPGGPTECRESRRFTSMMPKCDARPGYHTCVRVWFSDKKKISTHPSPLLSLSSVYVCEYASIIYHLCIYVSIIYPSSIYTTIIDLLSVWNVRSSLEGHTPGTANVIFRLCWKLPISIPFFPFYL